MDVVDTWQGMFRLTVLQVGSRFFEYAADRPSCQADVKQKPSRALCTTSTHAKFSKIGVTFVSPAVHI